MGKISVNNIDLNEIEQLSREELKHILGGDGAVPSESTLTKECGDWCGGANGDCNGSCRECKEGVDPLDPSKKANVCQ